MKLFWIHAFLLLLLLLSPISLKAEPVEGHSHHHLLLVHGIGGDRSHFAHTGEALSNALSAQNPSTHYPHHYFEYETENDEKTPYEFAQDLQRKIQSLIESENFQEDDRISLVMHSQGGLVGSIWLFQSMRETPGFGTPETLEHIDAFITVGSPFWGAKTAEWGAAVERLTAQFNIDVLEPFGKKQLELMSFGSDMIFDFRNALVSPDSRQDIVALKDKVRWLNIAGVANLLNPLGIFVSGTDQYEDDGAVPLTSARFNFLYNQSLNETYEAGDRVLLDQVREVDLAPFRLVNAMHLSPLPEVKEFAGIVQAPSACLKDAYCEHPSFSLIWKHILGKPVPEGKNNLKGFKTFLLDLNVRLPRALDYECSDIKVRLTRLNGKTLKGSGIAVKKFYELYSSGVRKSQKYKNHCRMYYTGSIEDFPKNAPKALLIQFEGVQLKSRLIEMRLRESYSSYVDINLVVDSKEDLSV